MKHPQTRLAQDILTNYRPSTSPNPYTSLNSTKNKMNHNDFDEKNQPTVPNSKLAKESLSSPSTVLNYDRNLHNRHQHSPDSKSIRSDQGVKVYTPRLNLELPIRQQSFNANNNNQNYETVKDNSSQRINSQSVTPTSKNSSRLDYIKTGGYMDKKSYCRYPAGFPSETNTSSVKVDLDQNNCNLHNSDFISISKDRTITNIEKASNSYNNAHLKSENNQGFQSFRRSITHVNYNLGQSDNFVKPPKPNESRQMSEKDHKQKQKEQGINLKGISHQIE